MSCILRTQRDRFNHPGHFCWTLRAEPLMADIAFACSLNQATGVVSEDVVRARFDVSLSAASVYLTPALCSLTFAYCILNRFTHLKWKKRPLQIILHIEMGTCSPPPRKKSIPQTLQEWPSIACTHFEKYINFVFSQAAGHLEHFKVPNTLPSNTTKLKAYDTSQAHESRT